jgi:hypothetical protein
MPFKLAKPAKNNNGTSRVWQADLSSANAPSALPALPAEIGEWPVIALLRACVAKKRNGNANLLISLRQRFLGRFCSLYYFRFVSLR